MLQLAGITRVLSVDDRHGQAPEFESVWSMIRALPEIPDWLLDGITAEEVSESPAAMRTKVEERWESADDGGRRTLRSAIARTLGTDQGSDDASLDVLNEVLHGHDGLVFTELSMAQWREERQSLLSDGVSTLLLVDRNFEGEGLSANEGLQLVKELLGVSPAPPWLYGLFMRTEDEQATWQGLALEGIDADRVVVISKRRLLVDPIGFARRVKMTLLAPECHQLTTQAQGILAQAHDSAAKAISDNIHMPDYEHIVFVRSQEEGVWEPDTLFRVYGMYSQREARRIARESTELTRLTERIRRIVAVDTGETPAHERTSWKVQRTETYEDPQYLQDLHLPLELGDIFARPTVKDFHYILLSQPCDLMLRGDGRRRIDMATVAPVAFEQPSRDPERHVRLPFYREGGQVDGWVNLDKVQAVSLDVLDLCVVSADGRATYERGSTVPPLAIDPIRHRLEQLRPIYDSALWQHKALHNLSTKASGDEARVLGKAAIAVLPGAPHPFAKPVVQQVGRIVSYEVHRVGRLNYQWAQDVLLRFVQHQGRLALEMELGRRATRRRSSDADAAGSGRSREGS